MTTIKSYTDLYQSKKLAEILPLESADYFHAPDAGIVATEPYKLNEDDETVITAYKGAIPCWSLASLLNVLPKKIYIVDNAYVLSIYLFGLYYWNVNNGSLCFEAKDKDNLVDACVEMIIKLNEQNLI